MCEIIVPVVTILNENEKPDFEGNKKVIDFLVEGGVDGILVLGSTGEFTAFSYEDKLEFAKKYFEYTNGRLDLYFGSNCPSFEDTVKLSQEIIDIGYKGAMVMGPYYFAMDQKKIYSYYDKLAKRVNGNIYIYNFPARSGYSISGETFNKLIEENSNIVGLKDSVSTPNHTNMIFRAIEGKEAFIYSGFDDQFLYNIAVGGNGCIGALANLVPEIWSNLIKSVKEKDFDMTIELSGLIDELMPLYDLDCNFVKLFKCLMKSRGLEISTKAITPYDQLDSSIIEKGQAILYNVIEKYKKLK